MVITKEGWLAWKADPVTKWFRQSIFNLRENLKENIARDMYNGEDLTKMIGQTLAIDEVLKAEPDFEEEDE